MIAQAASTVTQPSDFPAGRTAGGSMARIRAGRALSGFVALFLLMDGVMKLLGMPVAVDATVQLGYPQTAVTPIGLVLLACTLLYLIPRTAGAGAVLLTGYLGGAVATHVRADGSWFNILFPVICGVMVWGGLRLRNHNVRNLLPLVKEGVSANAAKWRIWTGRVLSAAPALLFLVNGTISMFKPPFVVEGTLQMGYPESTIVGMAVVLVASTLLYVLPVTSALGAVLLTGYLGGAVATHVRVGDPWSNIVMPIVFATVIWAGLWLRSSQVRSFWRGKPAGQ